MVRGGPLAGEALDDGGTPNGTNEAALSFESSWRGTFSPLRSEEEAQFVLLSPSWARRHLRPSRISFVSAATSCGPCIIGSCEHGPSVSGER